MDRFIDWMLASLPVAPTGLIAFCSWDVLGLGMQIFVSLLLPVYLVGIWLILRAGTRPVPATACKADPSSPWVQIERDSEESLLCLVAVPALSWPGRLTPAAAVPAAGA